MLTRQEIFIFSFFSFPLYSEQKKLDNFSVHGPPVWNSLPNDLRLSDMLLETFRSRLKAFLFGHRSLDSPFAAARKFELYK